MRTLLDDAYAPITSEIGFLEIPLERATNGVLAWVRRNGRNSDSVNLSESFPEVLHRLEPLRPGTRTRQLFVATQSPWVAYFDNGISGGDPTSVVSYLARTLRCRGVTAMAIPHTIDLFKGRCGQYGGVQFQLFGPNQTDFLNYVRTVAAQHDGSRWVFGASGEPQAFEMPERYRARRVPDRFTSEMLEAYCRAMGVDIFNPGFYEPLSVLVTSDAPSAEHAKPTSIMGDGVIVRTRAEPVDIREVSLAEVQREHCIGPAAREMLATTRPSLH